MPSFYSGWTETPSLDSLLYRNPVTAGELRFLVLTQRRPQWVYSVHQPNWDPSPKIKLNALNSASVRYWWVALFIWFPFTPSASHQHHFPHTSISLSFLLPFLNALFAFIFCWLNSRYRINLWEEENTLWAKISQYRSDSKQGPSSSPWASHIFLLIWREWHSWQDIREKHSLPHVSPQRQRQPLCYQILMAFPV